MRWVKTKSHPISRVVFVPRNTANAVGGSNAYSPSTPIA
jgi:hypothetical protein